MGSIHNPTKGRALIKFLLDIYGGASLNSFCLESLRGSAFHFQAPITIGAHGVCVRAWQTSWLCFRVPKIAEGRGLVLFQTCIIEGLSASHKSVRFFVLVIEIRQGHVFSLPKSEFIFAHARPLGSLASPPCPVRSGVGIELHLDAGPCVF